MAAERFGPRLAPEFNPFAAFDPGETTLSRLIAHLLDPKATHAQGDLFLCLLLDRYQLDWPAEATRTATVTTERPARMDVFVKGHAEGRDYRLAIENKLRGAVDQDRQIERYFEALEGMGPDEHTVVYLTVDGNEPDDATLPRNDRRPERETHLRVMSALDLAEWLDECRAWARVPTVAAHAEAFRTYINMSLLGLREGEMDELIDAVASDPDRVAAYMRALAVEHAVKARLTPKLENDLRELLPKRGLELRDWEMGQWRKWRHLGVARFGSEDSLTARLEFENTHYAAAAFGLHDAELEASNRAQAWHAALASRYGPGGDVAPGAGGLEDAWVWWQHLSNDHGPLRLPPDWRHAADVWAMMASGELAERIAEAAAGLFATVDSVRE